MARLDDHRWTVKRAEILRERGPVCEHCGQIADPPHVHHGCYIGDMYPWHYPDRLLHVLCATCHGIAQAAMTLMNEIIGALSLRDYEFVLELAGAVANGWKPRRDELASIGLGGGVLVVSR